MTSSEFRKELKNIMPGYKWTIHKPYTRLDKSMLTATGIITSGYNRISTLYVVWKEEGFLKYTVKSSGFGLNAPWLGKTQGKTLANALRDLQDHYEHTAMLYAGNGNSLKNARKQKTDKT